MLDVATGESCGLLAPSEKPPKGLDDAAVELIPCAEVDVPRLPKGLLAS